MTIYNLKDQKKINNKMCANCKYRKYNILCNGIGKVCFAYDTLTGNVLDVITGKPLTKETIDKIKEALRKEDEK